MTPLVSIPTSRDAQDQQADLYDLVAWPHGSVTSQSTQTFTDTLAFLESVNST